MQILAISADVAKDSLKLADKKKLTFPLLSDPEMSVISAYGVADSERDIAVPSVFYVGKDGRILWEHIGEFIGSRPSSEKILKIIRTAGTGSTSTAPP